MCSQVLVVNLIGAEVVLGDSILFREMAKAWFMAYYRFFNRSIVEYVIHWGTSTNKTIVGRYNLGWEGVNWWVVVCTLVNDESAHKEPNVASIDAWTLLIHLVNWFWNTNCPQVNNGVPPIGQQKCIERGLRGCTRSCGVALRYMRRPRGSG